MSSDDGGKISSAWYGATGARPPTLDHKSETFRPSLTQSPAERVQLWLRIDGRRTAGLATRTANRQVGLVRQMVRIGSVRTESCAHACPAYVCFGEVCFTRGSVRVPWAEQKHSRACCYFRAYIPGVQRINCSKFAALLGNQLSRGNLPSAQTRVQSRGPQSAVHRL